MKRYCLWLALIALVCLRPIAAAEHTVALSVAAGKFDRVNTPVRFDLQLPPDLAGGCTVALRGEDGQSLVGQVAAPDLLTPVSSAKGGRVPVQLHFILPKLAAGQTAKFTATFRPGSAAGEQFAWRDVEPGQRELRFGDRPVLRYMHAPLDESSPAAREATMKVYHHVFDPAGERLVTKGPGGLFPHHRGLFYGFNRISYDGKTADTWHCRQGEFQSHEKVLAEEAGPVLGRHRVEIAWHGKDKAVFAREQRELTAYHTPGGLLIEFASRLSSEVGPVKLDGDPQHAGFQFRASQEVPDKTAAQTYYLRPDGQGEPGKFRNWPADKGHANLPWNALSFVLGDQRYTCCYLDRPQNPKEARFSERNYGRFGSYFEFALDKEQPLLLNYRVWLQTGEQTVAGVQRLADDFVSPPVAQE